jgi:hypothetical protein
MEGGTAMKSLLAHGEKLFLVIVLAIAGYSLFSSAMTFRRGTVLPPDTEKKFQDIDKAYDERKPPDPRKLTYADHLRATVRSGTYKAGPGIAPWMIWPPPRPETGVRYVTGLLGVPGGFKAAGERARVELSWSEASTEYVEVIAYQVFKWKKGEGVPTEPTLPEETGTSLVDDNVEAEETYFYKVRAVGVAAPKKDNEVVDRPDGATEIRLRGQRAWVTECSSPVSATTPSNIDFVYLDAYDDFGTIRARMILKAWKTEEGGWVEYKPKQGVAVGEKIVGYRTVEGFRKEEFKTDYVLKEIGEEKYTYKTGKKIIIFEKNDEGETVRKEIDEVKTVLVKFILVESAGTGRPVKRYRKADLDRYPGLGGGASPAPVAEAPSSTSRRPTKKEADEGGDVDFSALRAEATGAGEVTVAKRGGGASVGTHAAPPANPIDKWQTYQNSQVSSLTFKVPGNWDSVAAAFTYGEQANATLTKDFIVAYAGPDNNMMVVQRVFVDEGPRGNATDELVRGYAEAWKKETLAVFPAAEIKSDVSVMPGFEGRLLGFFVATTKVGEEDVTIARYCGYATKWKRMFTFICSTPDYDALNRTYLKILATVNW